jgi:hypothetical protein
MLRHRPWMGVARGSAREVNRSGLEWPGWKSGHERVRQGTVLNFEKWSEYHKNNWVTASGLHAEVQQLLLPDGAKFSRQRVNDLITSVLEIRAPRPTRRALSLPL